MTFCAVVVVVSMLTGATSEPSRLSQALAWAVALTVVGLVVWLRRRDRLVFQRRLTQEVAARAVAEDRLEISRQLHETISASLGAITVRCAVAQRLETEAPGLRQALSEVEQTSRQATDGLRQMLAVLRDDVLAAPPTGTSGGAGPQGPGLSLAALLERARAQGLRVQAEADVEVTGTALAVVAEALSNSARHAGPTSVEVTTRVEPGPPGPTQGVAEPRLVVRVADCGPVPGWHPEPGASVGLRGLRERVEMAGGGLWAGARADRCPGFEVRAWLPHPPGQPPVPTCPRGRGQVPADG